MELEVSERELLKAFEEDELVSVATEAENAALVAQPPVTGAQYAQGVRPVRDGTLIVDHAEEACPVPAARQGSTSPM